MTRLNFSQRLKIGRDAFAKFADEVDWAVLVRSDFRLAIFGVRGILFYFGGMIFILGPLFGLIPNLC